MATIYNAVTSGYVSEEDIVTALSATRRSMDSLSTALAISDEDGSGSGSVWESSFWESSDRNDCDSVDSDALTQFSGSLSDQEQNGAVRMNQEERIMSDVSECMLDDGGETSSESECLSGKSGKLKRVLQPQVHHGKGHCVPRKRQIQSSSEDESDIEQSVCARVNVKGTMPGDIQKHTCVLQPRNARGCCAPPKKLICRDESNSEDESETKSDYVRGRRSRSGGGASVHGWGRRRGDKGKGGMFAGEKKGGRGISV